VNFFGLLTKKVSHISAMAEGN